MLYATTIVPYENLGALADHCDALVLATVIKNYEQERDGQITFRSRLTVENEFKGDLQIGEQFDVQKWEKLIDDKWMTMWGDLNLYENARYLLFLEKRDGGLYHPICYAYYVFEEISMNGQDFIVPSEEAQEFELLDLKDAEPLFVYQKEALFGELKAAVSGTKIWDSRSARTQMTISDFFVSRSQRAAPTGCTYLYAGTKKIRWTGFPDQSVGIHYNANGALGCSNSSINDAQQAILDLQSEYPGIKVVDAGTVPNMAQCAIDMSALGSDYRTYIDNNFGSYRNIIIQYDDPCNEIANLSNCAGILAIGGVYGIGSHSYDGEDWATGKYGYVVLNNGFGACKCSASASTNIALRQTLSHELSHALGLGHISVSQGLANMNPSCCQAISSVDRNCFNYTYPPATQESLLPVELVSFSGESGQFGNQLSWETAWEANVIKYEIQRSVNESSFATVGIVMSKGDSDQGHTYKWFDNHPDDQNYYRLKSVDLDGTNNYSQIVELKSRRIEHALIYPTATRDEVNVNLPDDALTTIQINSSTGKLIDQMTLKNSGKISVRDLASGWYYIQISTNLYSDTFRFFKSE
jgi:hypothetical protein